jgi:hypothetical protein
MQKKMKGSWGCENATCNRSTTDFQSRLPTLIKSIDSRKRHEKKNLLASCDAFLKKECTTLVPNQNNDIFCI